MAEKLKAFLAWLCVQLWHRHDWHDRRYECKFIDLPRAVWPLKAPYLEICDCGATRLREES
jgi:hypothetical protein